MSLQEKISEDLAKAMKSGDKTRVDTLRMIRAQLIEFSKRGADHNITPEDEISILTSAAKKRKEAIEEFKKANRLEMVEKEESELKIIQEYLPKQLTEEEIKEIIKKYITETGASGQKDFGKVMPLVMKELKGKADGKLVQNLVKELL
ncbi:MAG TPA: GatB/YqeY domain-containing protein [Bacteroidota bacterium]|jgi:uncharacterized protein YqeY|nr:GatB/YqeY domain-containing protein [Bacteroidota bacterium]